MNKFTKEMVNSYADKLLIGLTEEENKMVLDEFEAIDKDIDIINTIEGIENVKPMTYALDGIYLEKLREDESKPSPKVEELLSNADHKMGYEIEVPKVVGNEI